MRLLLGINITLTILSWIMTIFLFVTGELINNYAKHILPSLTYFIPLGGFSILNSLIITAMTYLQNFSPLIIVFFSLSLIIGSFLIPIYLDLISLSLSSISSMGNIQQAARNVRDALITLITFFFFFVLVSGGEVIWYINHILHQRFPRGRGNFFRTSSFPYYKLTN